MRDLHTRPTRLWPLLLVLLGASGCTLLIDPDDSRLQRVEQDRQGVDAEEDAGASQGDGSAPPPPVCEGDCPPCEGDADCSDGLFCNGEERCDPSADGADPKTGCTPGQPVECNDGVECTVDLCDENTRSCVSEPDHASCDDGFACSEDLCAPDASSDPSGCVHNTAPGSCAPLPDSCGTVQFIELDSEGEARIQANFGAFTDQHSAAAFGGGCGVESGSREAVFAIKLDAPSDVTIDTLGSPSDTVLAVGGTCSDIGFASACHDDIVPEQRKASRIWLKNAGVASDVVYVQVSAKTAAERRDFVLNVRVREATSDRCGQDALNISGGGALYGRVPPVPVQQVLCRSFRDTYRTGEVLLEFTGEGSGVARFTAEATFAPYLHLRTDEDNGCSAPQNQLYCSAPIQFSRRTELTAPVSSGAGYRLLIDGAAGNGTYALTYVPSL